MPQGTKSTSAPAESIDRPGPTSYQKDELTKKLLDKYPTLKTMVKLGKPLTREAYVSLVLPEENPNQPLHIELEVELPPRFRHPSLES
jgi:hypothetical protein